MRVVRKTVFDAFVGQVKDVSEQVVGLCGFEKDSPVFRFIYDKWVGAPRKLPCPFRLQKRISVFHHNVFCCLDMADRLKEFL